MERLFLTTVAILEFCAVLGYLYNGQPRLAFVWFCYALATFAMAGVK